MRVGIPPHSIRECVVQFRTSEKVCRRLFPGQRSCPVSHPFRALCENGELHEFQRSRRIGRNNHLGRWCRQRILRRSPRGAAGSIPARTARSRMLCRESTEKKPVAAGSPAIIFRWRPLRDAQIHSHPGRWRSLRVLRSIDCRFESCLWRKPRWLNWQGNTPQTFVPRPEHIFGASFESALATTTIAGGVGNGYFA